MKLFKTKFNRYRLVFLVLSLNMEKEIYHRNGNFKTLLLTYCEEINSIVFSGMSETNGVRQTDRVKNDWVVVGVNVKRFNIWLRRENNKVVNVWKNNRGNTVKIVLWRNGGKFEKQKRINVNKSEKQYAYEKQII